MLITYKKLSLNQKSTYYYILCYFPIQFCVSLCIGCTGKRSGISVKGLRKFLSSEGVCCLCMSGAGQTTSCLTWPGIPKTRLLKTMFISLKMRDF